MSTAPLNPYSGSLPGDRYFGVGSSFPKPSRKHWNHNTPSLTRTASVPVLVNSTNGDHVSNELHPPFSRVHYDLRTKALEDSGYQGRWNLLRYSSVTQNSFDRSVRPEIDATTVANCGKVKMPLGQYVTDVKKTNNPAFNNQVHESSFDRVIFHSSCMPDAWRYRYSGKNTHPHTIICHAKHAPKAVFVMQKMDGDDDESFFLDNRTEYPRTFAKQMPTRVLENPLVKTEAGIVGPERPDHANTDGSFPKMYHP
ncbi:unnamed protein product [Amoebophrya sp. A120]|nr:unnamed protein product [Amoebophrya sp. A120]|eukprot:GSA120T00004724001.1